MMPQTIRTTGDRGLDRELDALRDALRRVSSVPSPASPGTIEQSPFGPYVRTIAEQPNSGASGDITFTDSGGAEITQNDQNFDFSSPPLCDDPPEDVATVTTEETQASDTFTDTNSDTVYSAGTHPNLDTGGTWKDYREPGLHNWLQVRNNRLIPGLRGGSANQTIIFAIQTLTSNSYSVFADAHIPSVSDFGAIGLVARADYDSTAYHAPFYMAHYAFQSGTGTWTIYSWQPPATLTNLGQVSSAMSLDTTHAVEFRVSDSAKSLYVDGALIVSSADNSITGASYLQWYTGLYIHLSDIGTSTNQDEWPWIDNFRVVVGVDSAPQGDSTYMSRCDHVHEGVHSIARRTASGTAGTAMTGDVVLQEDGGIVLNETVASSRVEIAEGFWRDLLTMGI